MTEASDDILRARCHEAIDRCTSISLQRVAQELGLVPSRHRSEDAGKPYKRHDPT